MSLTLSGKISKVFSVEINEELYKKSGEVVWVYIFDCRSVWRGLNHVAVLGFSQR